MYFTKSRLKSSNYVYNFSERNVANEDINSFDIFLSHSYADKDYIGELKRILEEVYGYTVYVDWITDGYKLDRNNVSKETADLIKTRMKQSNSMIFATSSNSPNSKWMPWELGYFDSFSQGKIAILPITENSNDSFEGQEYLALYPYITEEYFDKSDKKTLWINETKKEYVIFDKWLKENKQPYIHD
ncbi:MAG: toll/interleukin-1 receptor domain-containing protein [Candidatus Gastranaerophilaceae bacterium]|nr:toll/interleukin-1 receptor domain-containing protein [Candidatus Gastranaerophilaceae bacterium]